MDPLPLDTIAAAVGGRLRGLQGASPIAIGGISTDSRTVRPGELFVALRGDRFDGRRFIGEAVSRGAAAALLEPGPEAGEPPAIPMVEVEEAAAALERLASFWREEVGAERIAITGSVGKTTTKEFLGILLQRKFPTVRAPKSFNNLLGVSLTLLQADRKTRFIVCEVGTNAPGELSRLSRLVKPSRAIVTEIGQAHLQGFGDLDGVVRAKAEVFEGMESGGTAFIQEGVYGRERLEEAARAAGARVIRFGWKRGDYRIARCRRTGSAGKDSGESSLGFDFLVRESSGEEVDLHIPLPGRHNVLNALGSIAAARDAAVPWEEIREGLLEFRLPPLRFDLQKISGVTVIDDTYNASSRSVRAALREAGEIPLPAGGRRFLILGDLRELGEKSEEIHREIGEDVAGDRRFSGLVTVGKQSVCAARQAASHREAAPAGGRSFWVSSLDEVEDVPDLLEGVLAAGDLVLFKASRAMRLERAAEEVRRRLASGGRGRLPERRGPRVNAGTEIGTEECSTISTT